MTAAVGEGYLGLDLSRPVALKGHRSGTDRLVAPEETLENVRRFFPVMGITRVADITGLDTIGIPIVLTYRPNSRYIVVTQGKGLDLAAAKASAVMESIEAYTAERITRPLILGSVNDLQFGRPLADVDALQRTTVSIYSPDLPILWIEGRELFTDSPVWVPYEMVHTAFTEPLPTGSGAFLQSTNGLSSGNHFLEALSHGLCEAVERDAATLHYVWAAEAAAARRIDLRTVDDPDCRELLDRLERAGMSVGVWDMTTDIVIPAFTCIIAERDHDGPRLMYGSVGLGCHPKRGIALVRAITEAVQVRLNLLSGARDNVGPRERAMAMNPELMRRQSAVLVGGGSRDFREGPSVDGPSFDADVTTELNALAAAGIEQAIVVDLTMENFGIPVVRVLVPGLEGPLDLEPPCRLGRRAVSLAASRE